MDQNGIYCLPALTLAHLALAAAEIFARAAALILRLFLGAVCFAGALTVSSPNNLFNSPCKLSIFSLTLAACRSCLDVNSVIVWLRL